MNKRGNSLIHLLGMLGIIALVIVLAFHVTGNGFKSLACVYKERTASLDFTCETVKQMFLAGEGSKLLCGDLPDKDKVIVSQLVVDYDDCLAFASSLMKEDKEPFVHAFATKEAHSLCCIAGSDIAEPEDKTPTLIGDCCVQFSNQAKQHKHGLCGVDATCNAQCQCVQDETVATQQDTLLESDCHVLEDGPVRHVVEVEYTREISKNTRYRYYKFLPLTNEWGVSSLQRQPLPDHTRYTSWQPVSTFNTDEGESLLSDVDHTHTKALLLPEERASLAKGKQHFQQAARCVNPGSRTTDVVSIRKAEGEIITCAKLDEADSTFPVYVLLADTTISDEITFFFREGTWQFQYEGGAAFFPVKEYFPQATPGTARSLVHLQEDLFGLTLEEGKAYFSSCV